MSGRDFIVPARSWENIGAIADDLRVQFSLSETHYFPVIDFVERVLDQAMNVVRLEIATHADMGGAEGFTDPNGEFIMLRDDVYEDACNGDGRARFTVAHELGHLIMHTSIPLARAPANITVKPFRLSEPQANQFAAEILMPRIFLNERTTVRELVERHGVSNEAASNRVRNLPKILARKRGPER